MPKTVLTNSELVSALGLPDDILTRLQSEQGESFTATANEVISAIVNKICYQKLHKMSFKNPFAKYKGYPVKFGDTIENIFVDVPTGYTFDKDATDPFTKYVANVKALYATINYEMQYPCTIQASLLRRAALNEYGLNDLIGYIMSAVNTRKEVDEYQGTIYMLNNADLFADGIETLDVSELSTPVEQYKAITQKIVDVVTDFKLPCKDNNKLGVLNSTLPEKCLLVIKQELFNHINLDFLTGVFNLSKVDLLKKIITVRSFQVIKPGDETAQPAVDPTAVGEDIDFMILDEDGFDIHDALQDSGMIYNPKGKYFNMFTDSWLIMSYKYFYNARAYKITWPTPSEAQEG